MINVYRFAKKLVLLNANLLPICTLCAFERLRQQQVWVVWCHLKNILFTLSLFWRRTIERIIQSKISNIEIVFLKSAVSLQFHFIHSRLKLFRNYFSIETACIINFFLPNRTTIYTVLTDREVLLCVIRSVHCIIVHLVFLKRTKLEHIILSLYSNLNIRFYRCREQSNPNPFSNLSATLSLPTSLDS